MPGRKKYSNIEAVIENSPNKCMGEVDLIISTIKRIITSVFASIVVKKVFLRNTFSQKNRF